MTAAEDVARIAEAVVVRPGDTLVLALGADVNPAQMESFVEQIKHRLPEGVTPLVVDGDIHLYVLRPGEAVE